MKSHLSILSFIDCAFGIIFKKYLPVSMVTRFPPLSSRIYSLGFTLLCRTHFELSFVYETRFTLKWTPLHTDARCSSVICWKDCLFSTEFPLRLCQESVVRDCGPVFGLFCPSDVCVCFYSNTTLSWILGSEMRQCSSFNFIHFHNHFKYFRPSEFPYNFWNPIFLFMQRCQLQFEISLNLIDQFADNWHNTSTDSSDPWDWCVSFYFSLP